MPSIHGTIAGHVAQLKIYLLKKLGFYNLRQGSREGPEDQVLAVLGDHLQCMSLA
jgi:hypothetical protein